MVKTCNKCNGTKFKTHKFINEESITTCDNCGHKYEPSQDKKKKMSDILGEQKLSE